MPVEFLEDPLDVPGGVLDFVAGQQLGMADPSRGPGEEPRVSEVWKAIESRTYAGAVPGSGKKCSPAGGHQAPSLPYADPVDLISPCIRGDGRAA
jgi:hypothetical protein